MLKDITLGQYFPGNSFIHKMDPRMKIISSVRYIIILFVASRPLGLVLGVVLADIMESNFRRALIMATPKGGLFNYFLTRPISIIIVVIILAFALVPTISKLMKKKKAAN